ncbi:MAG: MmgE/PrpD family protein, partial [Pseudomonadota bacterium]
TIDLMLRLVQEADIQPGDIKTVTVHAGTNILKPIRYPIAANHLQAKFSLPAALSMIALARKAGKVEFSDAFVGSEAMQTMQRQIRTELDPEIEAQGFDKMRSRITITLQDGREIAGWADERYRGGPENPLTDAEVEAKARSCCEGALKDAEQDTLIAKAWAVLDLEDAGTTLAACLNAQS